MNLQIFKNEQFGEIRTIQQCNGILFVAADVCKALEIKNTRDAVSRLDDDEKADVGLTDGSQKRYYKAVNEYGLYNLVLSSRKPEAKAFKRWITHEVIPAIRKTGKYSVEQQTLIAESAKPPVPIQKEIQGVKYYNGVPVITKRELAKALGMDVGNMQYYIKKLNLLEQGIDYFLISGRDLFDFKHKYHLSKLCTGLTLITEKGARKIYEKMQRDYSPVLFEEKAVTLPNNTAPVDESRLYADIPGCKEIQEKIKRVKRSIIALEELIDEYNRWNKKEQAEHLFQAMNTGMMLCCRVSDIGSSKYNLIPDPYLYPPAK